MEDLTGREMMISCGAALFGLRLAIRSLGCQPETELFPDPASGTCWPGCGRAGRIP
jgi:hypothetical protein